MPASVIRGGFAAASSLFRFLQSQLFAARFGHQSAEGALMLKTFSESIVLRFAGNQ